jgi:NAD+ synthase (glutamine-hydrolysing)
MVACEDIMSKSREFYNLYNHDFVRIATFVPEIRVADPVFNRKKTIELMEKAVEQRAAIALFPELGISAYSCEDLFHQQALLDGCLKALSDIIDASRRMSIVTVVGLPIKIDHLLFNCAAVVSGGTIHGIAVKSYLPNYREYYELRQFAPADRAIHDVIDVLGHRDIPFGNKLLFSFYEQPLLTFYIEICEDLWTAIPPSSYAALAGATVMLNLSASNATVTKDDYRRQLIANQSARTIAAYAYAAAGYGESTTDLAWDGSSLIYENGTRLAESERFSYTSQIIIADIDLGRLSQERMRQTTFGQAIETHRKDIGEFRTISLRAEFHRDSIIPLSRTYERFPFVPSDPHRRDDRCKEVYNIQVQGLVKRFQTTDTKRFVIGVSGGLDSTQALIVCAKAADILGMPREAISALIMPGFATSARTLDQARRLTAVIGCAVHEIDIKPSCMQMFADIDHPFSKGEPVYDITFENVQAGERSNHLFRFANLYGGMVVGTSDLSELALGWSTYGIGDHMAHYHVNASVPKTLIQYLIHWASQTRLLGDDASEVLDDVLNTVISPELVPGQVEGDAHQDDAHQDDGPHQASEGVIGPYELQDFYLYYILRFGFLPAKVAFLTHSAWHDKSQGNWPEMPEDWRREYSINHIKGWLKVFIERFFKSSQYKRSCIANSPKVGSGGSLSPRGDWRAPSDSEATVWLASLNDIPEK